MCVFRALCLLIVFECLCLRMCLLSCVGRVGELLGFDLCCCDLWCFETHVVDLSVFLARFSRKSAQAFVVVCCVTVCRYVLLSDVIFLDLLQTNHCESICQGCSHRSRTKVKRLTAL